MVKYCENKSLMFHYSLLSPCIVMCETHLAQCIVSLFIFIVSIIDNEQNVTSITISINILLFLDVY
jgi:hypothetical protein